MSLAQRLRLTADALRRKPVPIATTIKMLQDAADVIDDPCKVSEFSEAVCSRGTKGCEVQHLKKEHE